LTLANVSPEDRRGALFAFLTIFGTLAGHTLLETARDALFLARLPASRLAIVYIAIAVAAVGVSQSSWGRRRAGGALALSRLLGGGALVTFGFWLLLRGERAIELYALYVWTGVLGSLAVLQFWMVLGELYTLGEAKRLYSVVWTGSLLGATTGAAAARLVSTRAPATSLVLAAAIVLAVTALGPALALGRAEVRKAVRPAASATLAEGLRLLRADAYVRALAVLVLVSTVALTLADYVFKSAVARTIPPEQLGSFFAGFYTLLNLLSLAAQLLAGGWLFQAIGLNRTLLVLPALLFLGASGLALGGGLAAALLLKGTDGALRNSLHRTGTELLFVPLAPGVRSRAKPLVDIVGQRGGQALASVLILSESVLRRGDVVLAAAAAATALVWIALVSELKGLYLDVFRVALREGTLRPALDLPPVDLASLETLIGALNSADDHEVVAAIDLLAAEGRTRLVPVLILYHPSQLVVLRALSLFASEGRTDFVPVAERLVHHADAEIRAAALRARTQVAPEELLLGTAAEDESPLVRATAAVGRVAGGWEPEKALKTLDELARSGDEATWTALGRAIAAQPLPAFEELLLRLAERGAPRTLVQVARAMGQLRSPRFLPVLLELLGQREVRGDARTALVAYGADGLAFLDAALGDASLPLELRRHLPRTIALFDPAPAAAVLERRIMDERVGAVRYRMLRGLNRIVAASGVELDLELLGRATRATAEGVFRALHWRVVLEGGGEQVPARRTPGYGLLVQLLRDKEAQAIERLLRLLALQYRGEDFRDIHRGLRSRDPRARASGSELLENLLRPPLRAPILALVGDEPDAARLAGAGELYAVRPLGYEAALERMLDEGGEALRCIAAHHVGELGLVALRPRLVELSLGHPSFFLSRVLERTLATLGREEDVRA
jgi:AAA family ATP:ADP antiporter